MATRSLNVVISGDTRKLKGALTDAQGHMDATEKRSHRMSGAMAKNFALAGAAAAGALVGGLKKSADAAKEAEKSQARMVAQLKASGADYRAHAKEIDNVIQKHSRLAGIDDEDLQDAFTNIVRATGNVKTAMHDMGLVTDIARGKHIDVTKAADLLGKVHAGNVGILKRYGIAIDPVTKAQDKLKDSNKKATDEQVKAAKAADKTATSQKAIAELQKRFGGQAEAYGKTAAGAQDRFRVALENVEERLGKFLLPVITKVTGGVAKFLEGLEGGGGPSGKFASAISSAFHAVKTVIGSVVGAVRKYLDQHREDIRSVVKAFKQVAEFAKTTWQETLLPIIKRTVGAIGPIIDGLVHVIRGVIRTISGLLSGNWSKAWDGAKEAVGGAVKVIWNAVKTMVANLWETIKDLGPKLVRLIVKGLGNLGKALVTGIVEGIKEAAKAVPGLAAGALKGIGHAITSGISKGFGALNPFGDGLGSVGGSIPGLGGGGSLMGADPDLAPFASLASSMGLRTTSGIRPGATTISGNVSYHSSGDAIDEAGPVGAMHRYASALFHQSGGRLRELISPWPELGIKDGRPFRYSPAVQAQHSGANAHVHVAYTGPFGDGLGQIESLWMRAGGKRSAAAMAAAIAMAESGGRPGVSHRNSDGSIDRGLWQINSVHGSLSTFDRLGNARAAVRISGNGSNWGPWSVYNSGAYRQFLGAARAALGGSSSGGGGGGGRTVGGGGSSGPYHPARYDPAAIYGGDVHEITPEEQFVKALARGRGKGVVRGGPAKGFTPEEQAAIAANQAAGDTGDPVDDNTAALEELNRQIEALKAQMEEQARLDEERNRLLQQQRDDAQRAYAVSQSQYGTFKGFFGDLVNDYLGSRVGLGMAGLRAPAGSLSRA